MKTSYYIDISIQTQTGPHRVGRFEFGDNREAAAKLFRSLKASPEVDGKDMLYIELMETVNGLPLNLDILTCNLQELGINTMLIVQEIFRLSNLQVRK